MPKLKDYNLMHLFFKDMLRSIDRQERVELYNANDWEHLLSSEFWPNSEEKWTWGGYSLKEMFENCNFFDIKIPIDDLKLLNHIVGTHIKKNISNYRTDPFADIRSILHKTQPNLTKAREIQSYLRYQMWFGNLTPFHIPYVRENLTTYPAQKLIYNEMPFGQLRGFYVPNSSILVDRIRTKKTRLLADIRVVPNFNNVDRQGVVLFKEYYRHFPNWKGMVSSGVYFVERFYELNRSDLDSLLKQNFDRPNILISKVDEAIESEDWDAAEKALEFFKNRSDKFDYFVPEIMTEIKNRSRVIEIDDKFLMDKRV